jgi:sensor histidine kinase YesM
MGHRRCQYGVHGIRRRRGGRRGGDRRGASVAHLRRRAVRRDARHSRRGERARRLLLGYETGWTYALDVGAGSIVGLANLFVRSWPRYLVLAGLFALVYPYVRRRRESEAELRRLDLERAHFEQRTTEAQLQRLQAQIEPHFLFNTLAHVKRLYRTDAVNGRAMLDDLMRYLADALPQMREPQSTVAREMALAEAYLRIQKVRMGRRVDFRLETGADEAESPVPPMMLLTLVENAIKHGLSPLPEGGSIVVRAVRSRGQLALSVVDDGRGFVEESGAGTGLSNIRARLTALYGSAACLTLATNAPRGVAATLMLPVATPSKRSAK